MPILTGTENTLLCPRFGYGKRISTRAKSVNSENRHRHANPRLKICDLNDCGACGLFH